MCGALEPTDVPLHCLEDALRDGWGHKYGYYLDLGIRDYQGQGSGYHVVIGTEEEAATPPASLAPAPARAPSPDCSAGSASDVGTGSDTSSASDWGIGNGAHVVKVALMPDKRPPMRDGADQQPRRGALVLRVASPDGGGRLLAVDCGPVGASCGPEAFVPLAELDGALDACDGAHLVATVCVTAAQQGKDSGGAAVVRASAGAATGGAGAASLRSMLDDPTFADVTLRAAGCTWRAHRVVLAAASPVLAAMLAAGMREAATAEVCLDDMPSPEPVDLLLHHIYGHDIAIPLVHAPALLGLAQRYILRTALAPQLLARLLASRPSPRTLAVLLPAALEACPLACEAGLFRQAAEAAPALSGEPAWLEGAQPAAVAGVMAHMAPDAALKLAGEWVAAGGAAGGPASAAACGDQGVTNVDSCNEGRAKGAAAGGVALLPAPALGRASHWQELLGALQWRRAGPDQLATLSALLRDKAAAPPAAEGCWGLDPHMAGLQQALIARYQLQCEQLAQADSAKQAALEGKERELVGSLARLRTAKAQVAEHKRSAKSWQAGCEKARRDHREQQELVETLTFERDEEKRMRAAERDANRIAAAQLGEAAAKAACHAEAELTAAKLAAAEAAAAAASGAAALAAQCNEQLAASNRLLQRAADEARALATTEQRAAAYLRGRVAHLEVLLAAFGVPQQYYSTAHTGYSVLQAHAQYALPPPCAPGANKARQ